MDLSDFGGLSEHDASEGDDVEAFEGCMEAFIVLDEASALCGPCEGSLDDPSSWQQHEAALGLGQSHDFQRDAVLSGGFEGLWSGIALIDEGQFDALAGGFLHGCGEPADLGAIVSRGGRDVKGEQMPGRLDRQMQLGALLAFGSVIAGTMTALRRRAQRPAVQNRSRRLCRPTGRHSQQGTQVVRQRREAASIQPSRAAC